MARGVKDEYQQLWDGSWYLLDDSYSHQCCDCGLVHSVDFKLENGRLFQRWSVDTKETRKARRGVKNQVTSARKAAKS